MVHFSICDAYIVAYYAYICVCGISKKINYLLSQTNKLED